MTLVYEARRTGWTAILAPPIAVVSLCFLAWLAGRLGTPGQTDRILTGIVQVASLTGGIAAVGAVASDPAIELRLSLASSFRRSVLIRLAIALAWAAAVSAAVTEALHASARLTSEIPGTPAADQLEWLAPMLLLAGLGSLAAITARGSAAGVALVGVIWVLSNVLSRVWQDTPFLRPFWSALPFDPAHPAEWYSNRFWMALVGASALLAGAWLLGRPEHLLGGDR